MSDFKNPGLYKLCDTGGCISGFSDYSMADVTMKNRYLINGRDRTYAYLKEIEPDRYAAGFRKMAGLPASGEVYGGWETGLMAGHTAGHYMTALAQGYCDTGDEELLALSRSLIDKLYEAQIKEDAVINGQPVKKGYLFALTQARPGGKEVAGEGQFDNVEQGRTNCLTEAWVPWYTMHKLLAGLIDTYKLTDNSRALEMADSLGTWVYNRVGGYTPEMQKRVLNTEYGGMNDALYELYKITRKIEHARAAHMFDEADLIDSMYRHEDVLTDVHANTTIPKFIGVLNRVRATDESNGALLNDAPGNDREYYLTAVKNFWDIVVNDHSYITGGNSENEHFRAPRTENAFRSRVNCETCNTYNMLKLSRELYKLTGEKKYADYYENTFLNAIVSSQNPKTGMTMYFQPMATGYRKLYSTKWQDFWCCTGSGMENFTKLTDSIYYKKSGVIVINQYISSEVRDCENNIKITQNTDIPYKNSAELIIEPLDGLSQTAEIMLRIPEWAADAPAAELNGENISYDVTAGYIVLRREWTGDTLKITIPMEMRAYALADSETAAAFKYGPVVLSAGLGQGDMTDESHGIAVRKPRDRAKVSETIVINREYGTREKWFENLSENMVRNGEKLEFAMKNTSNPLVFTPHYKRHDERYGIYWYLTDK